MDINTMTVDELKTLKNEINNKLKEIRKEITEQNKVEASQRYEKAKGAVEPGNQVRFLYKKGKYTGKVVRVSEKSVTVDFEYEGEQVKKYRKYSDILEILE